MILVLVLLGFFCLVGLSARHFGMSVRWLLLAGVVALVMIDLARRTLS